MKTNIQIFESEEFGKIRTCQVNNQIMFVGKDVAKALGYRNTRDALSKHVDGEDKTTVAIRDTGSNYKSKTVVINESGLYSLILSSKLEQARAFKRWVTNEVLPQIRMTGGYIPTHDAEGNRLSDEEIVERAHEIIGRTLELQNSTNADCLTATQVAAGMGMEVVSFNNLLELMGILYRKGERWYLTDELQGKGLAVDRCYLSYSLRGKPRLKSYLVWTPDGARFLNESIRRLPRE